MVLARVEWKEGYISIGREMNLGFVKRKEGGERTAFDPVHRDESSLGISLLLNHHRLEAPISRICLANSKAYLEAAL